MRLAIALICFAAPVMADARYDGRYFWRGGDAVTGCDADIYSDGSITIANNKISFLESSCELTHPTALRDMPQGMLFDAIYTGEGETWTERMMVYETFNGVAVISRGAVRSYSRCE